VTRPPLRPAWIDGLACFSKHRCVLLSRGEVAVRAAIARSKSRRSLARDAPPPSTAGLVVISRHEMSSSFLQTPLPSSRTSASPARRRRPSDELALALVPALLGGQRRLPPLCNALWPLDALDLPIVGRAGLR
jgi:hypothetical protein